MVLMSITFISAMALLFLVFILSLIFIGAENTIFHIQGGGERFLDPLSRAFTRRCADGNCPPSCLYLSCGCLLLIFLLIPMGALPQFISTDIDLFMVLFLLLAAQGFYIRGIKNLFDIYLPIVDGAFIFDNSEAKHELLADKQIDTELSIVHQEKFNLLKYYYDSN